MRTRAWCILFPLFALLGCGNDGVGNEDQARRAYLGLEPMIDKAMDLGFKGFNAASSANIPPQSANGNLSGTITVGGKVDQGVSDNKEMGLGVALVNYSDVQKYIYDTNAGKAILNMSLKKIPNGTMTGTLNGTFAMRGDLQGNVTLTLTLSSQLEPLGTGVHRKPGTVVVTGTATSGYGTYQVNLKL